MAAAGQVASESPAASEAVLGTIGLQDADEAFFYGQWLRFFRLTRAHYLASRPVRQ